MTYTFKLGPEMAWAVAVAAVVAVLQVLVEFDPSAITDWRAWAIALGASAVRAAAGAAIAIFMGRAGKPEQ